MVSKLHGGEPFIPGESLRLRPDTGARNGIIRRLAQESNLTHDVTACSSRHEPDECIGSSRRYPLFHVPIVEIVLRKGYDIPPSNPFEIVAFIGSFTSLNLHRFVLEIRTSLALDHAQVSGPSR